MKIKSLLIIPMCLILLSGCNLTTSRYTPSENQENTPDSNPKIEDFFNNSPTTYTDNITSTSLTSLYETCKKATVTIETYVTTTSNPNKDTLYSTGSGFIVKESEHYLYIYTNAHVLSVSQSNNYTSIKREVILHDYSRYSATFIASNDNEDVGIVRIDKPNNDSYLIAALGDSDNLKHGEDVFAIGSPLGLNFASTITSGIVSGVNIPHTESNNSTILYLIQTDAALNPGNSGGPLFNSKGEVIGINTLKRLQSDSGVDLDLIGFAIPVNHFDLVAQTIIDGSTYVRPQIGIQVVDISAASLSTRESLGITASKGLYIDLVTNTNSGLSPQTIITKINNIEIITKTDFTKELYKYKVGDIVTITYCTLEGSSPQIVNVTLI